MQKKSFTTAFISITLSILIVTAAYVESNDMPPGRAQASTSIKLTGTPHTSKPTQAGPASSATSAAPANAYPVQPVQIVLTTTDQKNQLTPQQAQDFTIGTSSGAQTITVNDTTTSQQILGFGASLNDTSIWVLENYLTQAQRDLVMDSLFDPNDGIGMNILRQPIGGSDQDPPVDKAPTKFCSYDDNGNIADPQLTNFSIRHDVDNHTIDLLQQALKLNPQLRIMGSPWCIPQWMLTTTSGTTTLNPTYYGAYANYLMAYIQAYSADNLPIWAITPQNEPYNGIDFSDNLNATQEENLINGYLGPGFKAQGIDTGIIIYDHNWDHPEYPESILASAASSYVLGTGWHKYAGSVQAQNTVHSLYPNKATFFTEDSPASSSDNWNSYMPEIANRIIDVLRTWSETYIEWTIAENTDRGPGYCGKCGADMYIDPDTGAITYTLAYYALGQFSKYIKPGATRIDSNDFGSGALRSIAFKNTDGTIATVVYNDSSSTQAFSISWRGDNLSYTIPSKALATFIWSGDLSETQPSTNPTGTDIVALQINHFWHRRYTSYMQL